MFICCFYDFLFLIISLINCVHCLNNKPDLIALFFAESSCRRILKYCFNVRLSGNCWLVFNNYDACSGSEVDKVNNKAILEQRTQTRKVVSCSQVSCSRGLSLDFYWNSFVVAYLSKLDMSTFSIVIYLILILLLLLLLT